MCELMESLQQLGGSTPVVAAAPPPPPPTHHRRPRVREVSSRFMSPLVSSSSSGDLHLLTAKSPKQSLDSHSRPQHQQQPSSSVQKQRHLDMEPLRCGDENRPVDFNRSLETPFALRPNPSKTAVSSIQRKHSRTAAKLLKESDKGKFAGRNMGASTVSRPGTPNVAALERMSSSRLKFNQRSLTTTAAAQLLRSSGMSSPSDHSSNTSVSANSSPEPKSVPVNDYDDNSKQNCRTRLDLRASLLDTEILRTVSSRYLTDKNCNKGSISGSDSVKIAASPCSRSLSTPRSSCESSLFQSMKGSDRLASMIALPRPPVPPGAKMVTDAKKGRKVYNHQEDVHSLRMLHNRYLQWRFANAKAEISMQSQINEVEQVHYSLGGKIVDLYDSVKMKRIELGYLQRIMTLSTILESQIPYLERWSALEEDYTASLSEVIQSLLNTSLRLPVNGNIRADPKEVGEAMNSAVKMMEMIASHVQHFMPKAKKTESLMSELARVTGGEKSLVEECGSILFKTYASQVEECSLRSQLIQQHRCSTEQPSRK